MPHSPLEPFADWSDEGLLATVAEYFGVGADSDLPEAVRFLVGVTRLIRRRLAKAPADAESDLAMFCLFPVQSVDDVSEFEEVPMLDDGTSVIGGWLWRVGPAAASGVPTSLDGMSDAQCFQRASAIGAGGVPTIVFKPEASTTELRFFPRGVERADDYRPIGLGGGPIPIDRVLEEVDGVHHGHIITPDAQSAPAFTWKNSSRHRPVDTAEKVVQHYLQVGLSSAFPSCRISAEQPGTSGRTDLEVEEIAFESGQVTRHALLELKVLRSYRQSGTEVRPAVTKKWVKEGVEQAAAYRDERGTKAAALCCFDMRKDVTGQACFAHVAKLAKSVQVSVRCWHVFASAKKYRELAEPSGGSS